MDNSYDLPRDVFGLDEKRPERVVKKKIVKRKHNGSISEVRYILTLLILGYVATERLRPWEWRPESINCRIVRIKTCWMLINEIAAA